MKSAIIAVGPLVLSPGKPDSCSCWSIGEIRRRARTAGQLTPGMMTMRPDIASGEPRR
jgi:hypothetical protein